jgi:AraC family carnitine catabolism transcriptional activator
MTPRHAERPRSIAIVVGSELSLHSTFLAIEPFRAANRLSPQTLFTIDFLTASQVGATSSMQISLPPTTNFGSDRKFDLVILIATFDINDSEKPALFRWLRRQASAGAHLCAADAGPLLLAEAGLLTGYRATSHWSTIPSLLESFPEIDVVEQLFVVDRTRSTCAGQVAVVDCSMYILRQFCGDAIHNSVGNDILYNSPRPPETQQRAVANDRAWQVNAALLRARELMTKNVETPLSIQAIAVQCGVSSRELQYLFQRHLHGSPKDYYMAFRLQRAKHLLLYSSLSVQETGLASGFTSPSAYHRAFRKHFQSSPLAYRQAFTSPSSVLDGRRLY